MRQLLLAALDALLEALEGLAGWGEGKGLSAQ
jgi:hypothetical protein